MFLFYFRFPRQIAITDAESVYRLRLGHEVGAVYGLAPASC